jgi:hypothetical protein
VTDTRALHLPPWVQNITTAARGRGQDLKPPRVTGILTTLSPYAGCLQKSSMKSRCQDRETVVTFNNFISERMLDKSPQLEAHSVILSKSCPRWDLGFLCTTRRQNSVL